MSTESQDKNKIIKKYNELKKYLGFSTKEKLYEIIFTQDSPVKESSQKTKSKSDNNTSSQNVVK